MNSMKQTISGILLIVMMAMASMNASAQVKDFEKYAKEKGMTYIYVSKFMLNMIGGQTDALNIDLDMKSMMSKLDGVQIIVAEAEKPSAKLRQEVLTHVEKGKYELMMQLAEDDVKVDIYYLEHKRKSTLVMLQDDKGIVTLIAFTGTFATKDVMNMMKK